MSLHRNRGAKRARQAREALGIDPAAPLEGLLDCVEERAGLRVVVTHLPEGVAGACTSGPAPVLWLNAADAKVRQRFTLAHELGHVRCAHDGKLAVEVYETLNGGTTNPREIEANAFAAEFLIPQAAMQEIAVAGTDPTLDEVVTIAAHYGTSAIMVLYRFKQFGMADDASVASLLAAIEAREHFAAFDRLGCAVLPDRLGSLDELPYLSPPLRDSRLGAVLRGDAEAEPELATAIARVLS